MPCDAAEQVRARIVNLAAHPMLFAAALLASARDRALPAAFFSWRDARSQAFRRFETSIFHPQRAKDIFSREFVNRLAAHAPDEFREHDEIHVGVDEARTGFGHWREAPD